MRASRGYSRFENTDKICDRIFLERVIDVYGFKVPYSCEWCISIDYIRYFASLPELREYRRIMPMLQEYLMRKIEQRNEIDRYHIIIGGRLVRIMPSFREEEPCREEAEATA